MERRRRIARDEVDELEAHLRDSIDALGARGLDDDEAFLVAIKRMGSTDAVAREFAREHSDRLWKQLVLDAAPEHSGRHHESVVVLALGASAGVATCIGVHLLGDAVPRFLALFVLPLLAAYFGWKRGTPARVALLSGTVFAVAAVVLAVYPFVRGGSTEALAAMHAPVLLWLVVGVFYTGGAWRSSPRRMDFVRFTGEFVIYYALIALGGGVVCALTINSFHAIGIDAEAFFQDWLIPGCAAGAVLVAAWLVEAKQDVIENMAPVLTRIFTPVTLTMLIAVLAAFGVHPGLIGVDRDLLVLMAGVLVLVMGLLLYAISARDPRRRPDLFDGLQVALVVAAVVVDLIVLLAMVTRTAEFGTSPNKAAALGLNLLLLVSLSWSAWLGIGFVRGRRRFDELEKWQTAMLPVYAVWAAVVVAGFGWLFAFS
ncbi:permease prefix domain 1-containing protein [Tsukamurella sp. 8F]|uniref:permease prefix domain 1-containing protein n=1 Tax=unclassified Tsukamurella TaxID=2633480 RepID=UPI0023BA1868|nr:MULTISPECIES: permease prefix domain 1-containing protein [unclassified Tsukamurella]MDF0530148.1 permease prefix domain 1-containing protein [Tsukamurella sp. 8J]MDF0586466.1 permease prefix domain 1-containing protein [Tsukamurella sp. 8F]